MTRAQERPAGTETSAQRRGRAFVHVQLLIGMSLFGASTPLSKIIGESFSVFSASFARMAIAAAVLAPFALGKRAEFRAARRKDWIVIAAIALVGMVGFTATMLFGMRLTTGVAASAIMSLAPAVTAAAAIILLGSPPTTRKIAALIFGVLGALLINLTQSGGGTGGAVMVGALLVALAVCLEAAYTLLSQQLSETVSSLTATFAACVIAAPVFAALALLFDAHPFAYRTTDFGVWIAVAFWGAGAGGLAPILWYHGVRRTDGATAAGFMAVMPLSALLLSYALLGEPFRLIHLPGVALVFIGVALMIRERIAENK